MYEYFDEMYEEALEHHGILGMKWGVRRFQDKNGRLTSAGKSRYKTDKPTRAERKAAKAEAKAAKEQASIDEAKKRAIETANVDEIIRLSSKMTTDELRDAMARVSAISTMNKNRLPKEKTAFDKTVEGLGIVKKGADALKDAHESIRNLRKELGLDTQSVIEKANADGNKGGQKKGGQKKDDDQESKSDKEATVKKAFDFASKIKSEYDARKQIRDLQAAKVRAENNSIIEKFKEINASSAKPKANFTSPFKLLDESKANYSLFKNTDSGSKSLPKANFTSPFKLKDGDYNAFKTKNDSWAEKLASVGNITAVKLPDISVSQAIKSTSLVTKSTVKSIVSSSSKTDSTAISDINKMFVPVDKLNDEFYKRNQL